MIRRLITRFMRWLRGPVVAPIIDADLGHAIADVINAGVRDRDWFAWECEQYQRSPAWWVDPYRYHGTEFALPNPPQASINRVFKMSEAKARARYGDVVVDAMGRWAAQFYRDQYDPTSSYARAPDPVEFAMRDWERAKSAGAQAQ